MEELYLGLDVGTKNIKATIISDIGEVVEKATLSVYDLLIQPTEDFAERSPLLLYDRVRQVFSNLKLLNKVSGICIDATSGTIVPLDKNSEVIYNLIMYNDSRAKDEAEELRKKSSAAKDFERFLPITPQLVIPKLIWLKKNFDQFNQINHILHESDYIAFKLSDSIATSSNTAGKSHALLEGLGYLKEAYANADIPIEIMPDIKPIGETIGYTNEEATKLGLPKGIPIINGVTDASAGDITSGALNPGQANFTIGTALTVHAVIDKIVPDEHGRFYYKTYINNSYLAGGFTNAGTTAFDTMSKIMKMNLDDLTEAARNVPVGSDGLIACTEWYGVRAPKTYPQVKGFLIDMSEKNMSQGHIFRSLLEGSTMTLKLMLSSVEEVTRTTFYDIRASGGASKNSLLMQIISDALGKNIKIVEEPDSALGSAIISACSIGKQDIKNLTRNIVKIKTELQPNASNIAFYDKLTEKYRKIVENLAEIVK
jgi:sugar (pentulose or hexulose) kinase